MYVGMELNLLPPYLWFRGNQLQLANERFILGVEMGLKKRIQTMT
jgi:hypothetical protein